MAESRYKPDQAKGVWVWLEHNDSAFEGVSLELLGKGRELADASGEKLVALVLGRSTEAPARDALRYGPDEVVAAEDPLLERYTTDAFCDAAEQLLLEGKPNIFLLGATPDGRDLAGRLAARLRTGLTADCTGLETKKDEPRQLLSEVTGFGGGIAAMIATPKHSPQMATVRPGVFKPPQPKAAAKGTLRKHAVRLDPSRMRTEVLERRTEEGLDITKAGVLVVGGRGTNGDFAPLRRLAEILGAEIGATRVAVDLGWIGKEHMVGQTGSVTRPKLAVVCGVSGALQFTVGIKDADTVVSINSDPEAPIFESSDYCVAQDLAKVLAPLLKELESRK